MHSIDDRLRLAQAESRRLSEYIFALSDETLIRPSACYRWQVCDVITHLVFAFEYQMGMLARGLRGNSSPPEGLPPPGVLTAALASNNIHQQTMLVRERIGDRLVAGFSAVNDQFDELLASINHEDWDKPCYDVRAIVPARTFVDLRIMELVMHGWDIRSSLEPQAHLAPESLPVFMELISKFFHWLFWPGPELSSPIRFRFEVTDAVSSTADVLIDSDRACIEAPVESHADAAIRCDAETFVLLMYGRISAASALSEGLMQVEGDDHLVMQLGQWFKGF